ncbi:MAG: hypothetical protein Fur007_10520 [Rhodoferax sp.]
MKTAAVSVIIPCYRCAGTIERALASVWAQTLPPAEVILVDDASGDGTRALLQTLPERYPPGWLRLVLLDTNQGAASARNAGWAAATQPYVAFLDADDAWHLRKLEIQYPFMAANPDVVLCGHGARMLRPGVLPYWLVRPERAEPVRRWALLMSNRFVTPSGMMRRDSPHRFIAGQRYMEDHMLWLTVLFAGERVMKIPTPLAAIYKDPFGVTGLSARIWRMERSDLGNYRRLYESGLLGVWPYSALVGFSLLKFARRLVMYVLFLRWKRS